MFLGPDDGLSQPGLIGGFKAPHSPTCSVSRWPWGLHSPKLNLKPAICTAHPRQIPLPTLLSNYLCWLPLPASTWELRVESGDPLPH